MRARTILLVSMMAVTACAGLGETASTRSEPAPSRSTDGGGVTSSPAAETTMATPEGELVPVQAVLDGDSLAVERNGERTEVRLAGINAPEFDECFGAEARALLESLTGTEVTLVAVPGEDDEDQFARLLRNVWAGGRWLNHRMVEAGAALALQAGTEDEPTLVAAEDPAWEQGVGMWGEAVCGEFPPGVTINDVRFDPPGRDFENKEEEFVLVGNEGPAVVDVSGWILRDESSTHRFTFPEGLELAPGDGVRIRTGCGEDDGRDLYWCADDAVWSNGGDTVLLQTPGGTVVDRWKYAGDF